MLLAIDIGNTNISFAVFRGGRIIKRFDIPTAGYNFKKLRALLGKIVIRGSMLCSVAPQVTKVLTRDLKKYLRLEPRIVGKDVIVPIKNLYRHPREVGQDRLVNAYAGIKLYGWPLIVVDFGTAVTFDVVSAHKEYLGGMILPGLRISLDALREKTALLPKINLRTPREFIGRDTKSSMLSGLVYGFAALTDALVARIKIKIDKEAKVIATGGNVTLVGKHCKQIDKIDIDLSLKGLNLLGPSLNLKQRVSPGGDTLPIGSKDGPKKNA